jgi:hypothetical protein
MRIVLPRRVGREVNDVMVGLALLVCCDHMPPGLLHLGGTCGGVACR